jgi:hypothetical protein
MIWKTSRSYSRNSPGSFRRNRDRRSPIAVAAVAALFVTAAAAQDLRRDVKGIFLTSDYPAITLRPGETSTIKMQLRNYDMRPERMTLSVFGAPKDWTATFVGGEQPIGAVMPATDSSVLLELRLDVPKNAPTGTQHLIVEASGEETTLQLPLDVTLAKDLPAKLDLIPDPAESRGGSTTGNEAGQSPMKGIESIDPGQAAILMQKGRDLLGSGDISAARLVFGRLADAGNADAALALASTYDPDYLAAHNFLGVSGDRAAARAIYQWAKELRSAQAGRVLAQPAPAQTATLPHSPTPSPPAETAPAAPMPAPALSLPPASASAIPPVVIPPPPPSALPASTSDPTPTTPSAPAETKAPTSAADAGSPANENPAPSPVHERRVGRHHRR